MEDNDWLEYKQLFLHEMSESSKRFDKLFTALAELRSDVSGLKVKAAITGGAAGIVGTGIITAFMGWLHK